MSCLFCRIVAGEIPAERVGETPQALAFLDIQPLARGHVLVIPKRHAERVADMPPEDAAALFQLAQDVARRQAKALGAAGATLAVNDGRAAGQEVMHVHLHVVPRSDADGHGPIHALFKDRPTMESGELATIAAALRG